MTALKLEIEGMHCEACVRRVTNALISLPGVAVEEVSIGSAALTYDTGTANPSSIKQAIRDIGFEAASR